MDSASGCDSTWIVKIACPCAGSGMKVWRSVRKKACAASASASASASGGHEPGAQRNGWPSRFGWRVTVQTKRSQRSAPVTSRARWALAVTSNWLSATGACTSAKWWPTFCSGAQCEGRQTASQGTWPLRPSITAKSSANARLSSAGRRHSVGKVRRHAPMGAGPVPSGSPLCSDQPSCGASMRCSPSHTKAAGCSAAAWATKARSAGPASKPGTTKRACWAWSRSTASFSRSAWLSSRFEVS